MSELQRSIMRNNLPPPTPRPSGSSNRMAQTQIGGARRKSYTPVSWRQYFAKSLEVETESGSFRVYMSAEPKHPQQLRILTLHGGGYSGLSWALFTEEITQLMECQVISMDLRGHGETRAKNPDDLSTNTLVKDVEHVVLKLFGTKIPNLLLVGHSMGGALAVRVAHLDSLESYIRGLAVIDVVEGTAMDALASMQSFLRGRPTHFRSIEHAIEWCVRSGQIRNIDSAKVSMPSQIINCSTGELATVEAESYAGREAEMPRPTRHEPRPDRIAEDEEEPAPPPPPQDAMSS